MCDELGCCGVRQLLLLHVPLLGQTQIARREMATRACILRALMVTWRLWSCCCGLARRWRSETPRDGCHTTGSLAPQCDCCPPALCFTVLLCVPLRCRAITGGHSELGCVLQDVHLGKVAVRDLPALLQQQREHDCSTRSDMSGPGPCSLGGMIEASTASIGSGGSFSSIDTDLVDDRTLLREAFATMTLQGDTCSAVVRLAMRLPPVLSCCCGLWCVCV